MEGKKQRLVIVDPCGLLVLAGAFEDELKEETAIDPLSNPVAYRAPLGETSKAEMARGIFRPRRM